MVLSVALFKGLGFRGLCALLCFIDLLFKGLGV